MKIKVEVEEMTQDELECLLLNASSGPIFGYVFKAEHVVKKLLAGERVSVYDYYANDEDEHYGDCEYHFNEILCAMVYKITLDDVYRGVAMAMERSCVYRRMVDYLTKDEGYNADVDDGETIMQFIVFGELVYG